MKNRILIYKKYSKRLLRFFFSSLILGNKNLFDCIWFERNLTEHKLCLLVITNYLINFINLFLIIIEKRKYNSSRRMVMLPPTMLMLMLMFLLIQIQQQQKQLITFSCIKTQTQCIKIYTFSSKTTTTLRIEFSFMGLDIGSWFCFDLMELFREEIVRFSSGPKRFFDKFHILIFNRCLII